MKKPESSKEATATAISNLAVQEYWDQGYDSFQFEETPKDDPIRLWIEEHLPIGNGSCFEIGAFPGRYLSIFGELGYDLHGIDLHDGIVSRLPDWLRSLGFKVGDFIKADFTSVEISKQYDVVCSFGFIEHFDRWDMVVRKMFTLVKPGGILIIETPNFSGSFQRYLHCALDGENVKRHNLASMDPELWARLAVDNGFETLASGYFGGFDFWVDHQDRTESQNKILNNLYCLLPFLRRIEENDKSYSPYCGLIARKKSGNA
jgi:2-polyprenyl-3-methyl-5-hydroxy-6-metoxy-1,4-benzoquinol methylase